MQSRITKFAAAAVLLLAVLLLARHLTGRETPAGPGNETSHIAQVPGNHEVPAPVAPTQEQKLAQLARELSSAKELFAAGDAKGLLHLLETGQNQTKIAVANYLAQMGEESAIPALQTLADQWQGPPEDNPFRKCIEQVRNANSPQEGADDEGPTQGQMPPTVNVDRRITVQVSDKATGAPISHVAVNARIWEERERRTYATDEKGVITVDLAESTPERVRISVCPPGYVGQAIDLEDFRDQSLPKTVRLLLEKGTVIGGVVQDVEGRPIKGANVEGYIQAEVQFEQPRLFVIIKETTDDQGRWRADTAPARIDSLQLNVRYPGFADGHFSFVLMNLRLEDLQAERAVMVLDEGLTIIGRVVDLAGVPLAGVDVRPDVSDDAAKTDAAGNFQLSHMTSPNDTLTLTVQTRGYTPQRRELAARKDLPPIEFVLKPGKTLRGRVVDTAGQPIERAEVGVVGQGNWRSLKWSDSTDAKGAFVWDYPPDDSVLLAIVKEGYGLLSQDVTASDQEQTFVLSRPMMIRGTVKDSQTGEPVDRFKLGFALGQMDGDSVMWACWGPTATWFTNGRYSYAVPYDKASYAIRVEADGYLPAESTPVDANEQGATVNFTLTKGDGPSGYVFDADTRPAVGVQVIWSKNVWLDHGRADVTQRIVTNTDETGHFAFPAGSCREPILAIGDQGIGGTSYEELVRNGFITLQPWARVEGQWRIGSQPAAQKELRLSGRVSGDFGQESWDHFNSLTTDETGRFVFERVCPGELWLYDKTYTALPGQTLELKLGGTGRTVRGELAVSVAADVPIRVGLIAVPLKPLPSFDKIPKPAGYEQMSFEEVHAWLKQFNKTPEGKPYLEWVGENYPQSDQFRRVQIDDRSGFHVDNVEPGTYILRGEVNTGGLYDSRMMSAAPGQEYLLSKLIGSVWHEFEVPPLANEAEMDVPLNLGTLPVQAETKPEPGDPAPDFDVATLGVDRIRLTDYRGKVVLLTFIMADCLSVYPQGVEELKAVYECYREDARYAQVSLFFRSHPLLAKKAVDEAGLNWPYGLLRDSDVRKIFREYDVPSKILWNVLIDAQGRILAKGLSAESLEPAIDETLRTVRRRPWIND